MSDPNLVYFGEGDGSKLLLRSFPCSVGAAAPAYYRNSISLAFAKNSEYVDTFNAEILRMKQSGQVRFTQFSQYILVIVFYG